MMRSAIEWLIGKSETLSVDNDVSTTHVAAAVSHELENNQEEKTSNENSMINGYSSGASSKSFHVSSPIEKSPKTYKGEESKSPWGRTLTPKSFKHGLMNDSNSPNSSAYGSSSRLSSLSWEDMSFASDVVSPGFASRIAKEGRGSRKPYDGSRKYPIGQEKYIRSGVLPNVRLKSHSKPVVRARRAPTSPLLPLASQPSSPFSSSSITSGFLATASTRIPDISSVVSVLDSTPTSSAFESIKDPTSVQAVVAALEQAQSLKSGIKRSRYGETEDSNKKQKCSLDSSGENNEFPLPVIAQPHGSVSTNIGGGGGGEKRALDLSPPNSTSGSPSNHQLSPENKRRCVPDPRVASFSSSRNINSYANIQVSGRDTPISMYESHQDSDSESNKSMESHLSKQSERSYRGQNNDISGIRTSSQDQFDRSGSQTPQSMRGSYGLVGTSNGSNSSSRTTTPSRASHVFSLDAYKADKAKNNQRLNKMLGMLFNVTDEESDANQGIQSAPSTVSFANSVNDNTTNSQPLSLSIPTPGVSSSILSNALSKDGASSASDLLKEAFSKVQPELVTVTSDDKAKECENPDKRSTDVSATFTFTLNKSNKQSETPDANIESHNNSESLKKKENLISEANPATVLPVPSSSNEKSNNSSKGSSGISELKSFANVPSTTSTDFTLSKQNTDAVSSKDNMKESSLSNAVSSGTFPPFNIQSSSVSALLNAVSSSPDKQTSSAVNTSQLNLSSNVTQIQNSKGASNNNLTFGGSTQISGISDINTSGIFKLGAKSESLPQKSSIPQESNALNSSGVFPQPPLYPGNMSGSPSVNFSFGNSASASQIIDQGVKPNNSSTSQSTVPFVFGASDSSNNNRNGNTDNVTSTASSSYVTISSNNNTASNILQTSSADSSKTSGPNIFNANSLQPPAISNSFTIPTLEVTPISNSFTNAVSNNPNLNFNFGQPSFNTSTNSVTTSSVFISSNAFSLGTNTFKTSQPTSVDSTTLISSATSTSPSSSSSVFSFGDNSKSTSTNVFTFGSASKPDNKLNSSTLTTAVSVPTPLFGGSMGGGFSFSAKPATTQPKFGEGTSTLTSSAASATANSSKPSLFNFNQPPKSQSLGFDFSKSPSDTGNKPIKGFNFGSSNSNIGSEANKGFTFGGSTQPNAGSEPSKGFSFGSLNAQPNTVSEPKKGFTFGNNSQSNAGTELNKGFTFGVNNNKNNNPPSNTGSEHSRGFNFGNTTTTQSSIFGTATTTSVFSFGQPKAQSTFSFSNAGSTPNIFSPQSPPKFASGSDTASSVKFGSGNPVPTFGSPQTSNIFGTNNNNNTKSSENNKATLPSFGLFGGPKPDQSSNNFGNAVSSNQNVFQMEQNANQNAPFVFGQSASSSASPSSVFQFGSGGSQPNPFATGSTTSGQFGNPNSMGIASGANLFTAGASSDPTPSRPRVMHKSRSHRRKN